MQARIAIDTESELTSVQAARFFLPEKQFTAHSPDYFFSSRREPYFLVISSKLGKASKAIRMERVVFSVILHDLVHSVETR